MALGINGRILTRWTVSDQNGVFEKMERPSTSSFAQGRSMVVLMLHYRVLCENCVLHPTYDYVLTVLLLFFSTFLISLSETWGRTDSASGKLLLFVITHWWLIRLLFYRGVRESVHGDVIWRHTGVHNVWLARVIRTKLESQLGQVVVLSKLYYIYFLSYTDVPDFEAYHKYSQVYLIISRQW